MVDNAMAETGKAAARGGTLRRALPLVAIGAVAVLGFVFLRDLLSFQTLAAHREALTAWRAENAVLAAAIYWLVYVGVVAFSLPGALVMTLTGGFLFGLWAGSALTVSAATVGAVLIFLAARLGLGEALERRIDGSSGMMRDIRDGLRRDEISYLFIMRLVPAIPFFLANLAPALLGVRLNIFVLTTALGIIPGTVVYTWVGAGLGQVFEAGGTPNLGLFFEWYVIGPILGLVVLSALPILLRRVRRVRRAPGA